MHSEAAAMGGYVMQIQDLSVNDGSGIRSNIFLASCPLRCAWCANPEGQTQDNPLVRWMETEEVLRRVRRSIPFFRASGGGVTFTGGECTMQADFLRELATALYNDGLNLAMETCGTFDFDEVRDILEMMDLVFMDCKLMDAEAHRRFTGADNAHILRNIARTAALRPVCVRIPTVVGVNADEANMRATFAFLRDEAPPATLEFLPYHRYGEGKYAELGLTLPSADFAIPTEALLSRLRAIAREEYGITVVSYR